MRLGTGLVGGSCCVSISETPYINIIPQSWCEALSSHLSRISSKTFSTNPLRNARAGRIFGRNSHQTCVVMRPCDEYCARFLCQRLLALVTCTSFSIDELDRKTANDMRLRLTPANPHLREFVHDAHAHGTLPASFAIVQLQT